MTAPFAGDAVLLKGKIRLRMSGPAMEEFLLSENDVLLVKDGEKVKPGQQLTEGSIDPKELMKATDLQTALRFILNELQKVWVSQGVALDDKHMEVILRQMGQFVQIIDPGDTSYMPGMFASKYIVEEKNKILKSKGRKPATVVPHLLGVTNAALRTESFLSAMSFEQQVRVLTESALMGRVDNLRGLKENVIIGRYIPVGDRAELGEIEKLPEFEHERNLPSVL